MPTALHQMTFELKNSGQVDSLTLKIISAHRGARLKHKDGLCLKFQALEFLAGRLTKPSGLW